MRTGLLMLAAGLLVLWASAGEAGAAARRVSDLDALQRLCAEEADPGDVIEIQPGTYHIQISRIAILRSGEPGNPIVIRGLVKEGRRPIIDAGRTNVKRHLPHRGEHSRRCL